MFISLLTPTLTVCPRCRYFGIHVIPVEEAAWFPVTDLREMHGVKPHVVTSLEETLFAMHPDGSEGFCIRSPPYEGEEEDEDTTTAEPEEPRSPEEPLGESRSLEEL